MQHKHAWRTYVIGVWAPSHAHAFAHGARYATQKAVAGRRRVAIRCCGRICCNRSRDARAASRCEAEWKKMVDGDGAPPPSLVRSCAAQKASSTACARAGGGARVR
eukprot:6879666-Prymnesium_polylepis.1